jgi:hypothetical protein
MPDKPITALDNEFVKFGKTVAEVMAHRGKADDIALDANIGFILLDKEERKGLSAFTTPERHVYAVQGMTREVNNGGFEQFFFNSSGELAFDLVPALEAIGSRENLSIAQRALERFGKPGSLAEETRHAHLEKLVENAGEEGVWHDLEDEFYENPEDLEKMTLNYIARNLAAFGG